MDESLYDEADPLDDDDVDSGAEVACPHCGETVTILLDAGGGLRQEYVEDCEVCCRPWHVHVHYDGFGVATVRLEPG